MIYNFQFHQAEGYASDNILSFDVQRNFEGNVWKNEGKRILEKIE